MDDTDGKLLKGPVLEPGISNFFFEINVFNFSDKE